MNKSVADGYLEILGSTEPPTQSTTSVNQEEDELAQIIKDKQITLQKAMKAAQDGDAEEASYLFRLHSRMKIELPKRSGDRIETPDKAMETRAQEVMKNVIDLNLKETDGTEKPIVENGITFMPGTINRYDS